MSKHENDIDQSELSSVAGGLRRPTPARMTRAGREHMAPVDVAALAYRHGIPYGEPLVMATAIAGAESGWQPNNDNRAHPNRNGTYDVGLWQINSTHPKWLSYDPDTNAAGMAALSYGGKSWRAWSTYNNGAYRRYLPQAREAVSELGHRIGR